MGGMVMLKDSVHLAGFVTFLTTGVDCISVPDKTHSYRHTSLSEILNRIVGKKILLHTI